MPYKKFLKDFWIIGLANFLASIKVFIILPALTQTLGVHAYGVWSQVMVTFSLLIPLLTLGLPFSLVRFLSAEKDKRKIQEGIYSVMFLVLFIGLIACIFLIIFANRILSFLETKELGLVVIFAAIILIGSLNNIFLNVFRALEENKKYSIIIFIQGCAEAGLISGAVLLGYGLSGAVLSFLIVQLIIFGIMAAAIFKKIGIKFPIFSEIKKYLSFGLPTIPGNLAFWIVQSSDRYLIGHFLGVTFVGYYSPGYIVASALMIFLFPFSFILPPLLSRLYDSGDIDAVKIYLKYSFKYFLIVAIPFVFGATILSRQILTIFSTPEIASEGHLIVAIIALGILFFGGRIIAYQVLVFTKKTKVGAIIWIFAALVNLCLNFIFIPSYGIIGAALTTLIAFFIAFALTIWYSSRYFTFRIDWLSIIKSIFASIVMFLVISSLHFSSNMVNLMATIIIGTISYILVLFFLRVFSRKEIVFLKRIFDSSEN